MVLRILTSSDRASLRLAFRRWRGTQLVSKRLAAVIGRFRFRALRGAISTWACFNTRATVPSKWSPSAFACRSLNRLYQHRALQHCRIAFFQWRQSTAYLAALSSTASEHHSMALEKKLRLHLREWYKVVQHSSTANMQANQFAFRHRHNRCAVVFRAWARNGSYYKVLDRSESCGGRGAAIFHKEGKVTQRRS